MDRTSALFFVFLALLALSAVWTIGAYNRLVRLRNQIDAAWAEVDVQLTKRHDLVPNLVAVVQGYASHERGTLDEVVEARSAAISAQGPQEQAHAENMLTGALGRLFAQAEAYPELKADGSFEQLQARLADVETNLAVARRAYNVSVQAYANVTQSIPTNFVAWFNSFEPREFLSADESTRDVPRVDLPPAAQPF
ncbi:MAG: LemA protein [Gaiellaceae bacterium]|nr:LemA protein [Gaiellaceae bacterium]